MTKKEKEVINSIKEDKLYDYIANNYWDMSRYNLKDIILELDWSIYDKGRYCTSYKEVMSALIEHLTERWGEEDED